MAIGIRQSAIGNWQVGPRFFSSTGRLWSPISPFSIFEGETDRIRNHNPVFNTKRSNSPEAERLEDKLSTTHILVSILFSQFVFCMRTYGVCVNLLFPILRTQKCLIFRLESSSIRLLEN
ncbi:hypothetical protein SDJN03_21710, partial [Cucurbita argyrosperma subsp. sororia]